jgi:hypothetical protein
MNRTEFDTYIAEVRTAQAAQTTPTFAQRCAAIHAAGDRVRRADGLVVGRVVALVYDTAGEAALVAWPSVLTVERVALNRLEPAPLAVRGRGPA